MSCERYFLAGRAVSREEFLAGPSKLGELFASRATAAGHQPSCWPQHMESLAVHPSQIEGAIARNKRHGVNVTYAADGTAIVPDRNERRKIIKLEGFYDRSGGYGDG